MSDKPQCTHSKVSHQIYTNTEGHTSDRWVCKDCNMVFYPASYENLRDKFAMEAMNALLIAGKYSIFDESMAKKAYQIAEWMMNERLK